MKKYLDIPLIAFTLVMVAAASITSHGTYVFYSYFLDPLLAGAATVVLTVGIPLLELAAVLDHINRTRYVLGMVWLLIMEAVAQYWQGQAVYAKRIAEQFPDPTGIDLAMWANHWSGRALPIVYLALLSGIVVYFGFAASQRIRDIRAMNPDVEVTETTITVLDASDDSYNGAGSLLEPISGTMAIESHSQAVMTVTAAQMPVYAAILDALSNDPTLDSEGIAERVQKSRRLVELRRTELLERGVISKDGNIYIRNPVNLVVSE